MVDRRLGRGLDFFLSGGRGSQPAVPVRQSDPEPANVESAPSAGEGELVRQVPLDRLEPSPFQPRRNFADAELKALADSIQASGILQPILARPVGDRFQIVAGERRWRAARLAGVTEVPVLVKALSDQDSAVFALVENLQREDLNAIEKAQGIRQLMDQLSVTQEQVARQVGLDRSTVTNFLRLLDLPHEVQAHVSRGTLSMGHARSLLSLPTPEVMIETAELAIRQGMSVRNLEGQVRELLAAATGKAPQGKTSGKARPVWLNELEESLVDALGTPVSIRYGRKRSQIVIECAGREEFERVYQRLKNA